MKSSNTRGASSSRPSARSRLSASCIEEFASLSQTRALLASSAEARLKRLNAEDMISTEEAAKLNGTSRVTINAWIAKGRAIGLTQSKRGYRMPSWQFNQPMWSVLPELSKALGTVDGWSLLAFLETPQGGLNGATPRLAIESGNAQRAIQLAGAGA